MELKMVEVFVEELPIAPTLVSGGTPLFNAVDSVRLIELCKKNDIAILGVEGFRVEGTKRVPDMDIIVDLSASIRDKDFAEKSTDYCKLIIASLGDSELVMEFMLVKFLTEK